MRNLSREVRNYEPIRALNGGIDGLDLIEKVIYKSDILLKVKGILALEIHNSHYLRVSELLTRSNFKITNKVIDFKTNIRCILSKKVR